MAVVTFLLRCPSGPLAVRLTMYCVCVYIYNISIICIHIYIIISYYNYYIYIVILLLLGVTKQLVTGEHHLVSFLGGRIQTKINIF